MSRGLGPALLDFSSLGQLGNTYFDALDKAKLQAYQNQSAKLYDNMLLSSLAPQTSAPAAPVGPVADAGGVPDVLGTPKMRPAAPSFAAAPAPGSASGAPAVAAGRTMSLPGGGLTGSLAEKGRAIFNGLVQRGLSPVAAAGITGNIRGESAFSTSVMGDQGTSGGLAQWRNERLTALKQLAARQGKPWTDPEVQLDHLMAELKGSESGAMSALNAAKTPQEAALAFMRAFERPSAKAMAQSGPLRASAAASALSLYGGGTPSQVARTDAPLPPPRPAQLASNDPGFMPAASPAMARVQQEAASRGVGQQVAEVAPSRAGQFLTARAQNRAGVPTATSEGDPATPSDFVPGSTAVPAQPQQYGTPAPGAQPVGPTPTALSMLPQAQKDNLRAMLANPVTRQHAMQMIDKLSTPEEFEIKESGGQFYSIGKKTRSVQVLPGIAKPQEWTPFTAPDGNAYLINKYTMQVKRMIEGSKFQDVSDPNELARVRPPGYTGPVQRDEKGQIVYPGSGIHAADQRVDITDPAELARVRPPGYNGPVQRGRNGELYFPGAGAAGINLQSAGDAKAQEARIKRFEKLTERGDEARKAAVDIDNLRELGRNIGPAGAAAGFKEALGPYAQAAGIEIKGLSDIQAYQSIIKRLTPQMREPGSGSSSNFDVQMFEKALPGLLMHPDGREMVLDVMKAGNDYEADKAAIAQAALDTEANGGISHAEAARRMRELPEPIQRFKEFRANNPTVVRDALQAKAPQSGPPSAASPPVKVNTPAERDALPSGTSYIAPDGSVRMKK